LAGEYPLKLAYLQLYERYGQQLYRVRDYWIRKGVGDELKNSLKSGIGHTLRLAGPMSWRG
jgi:hypothetical protein